MSALPDYPRPTLRPLREHDLANVNTIEQRSYDYPWSSAVLADCLRVGYCCWAILAKADLAGYGIMTVTAQECHILNLCIDPDYRRRGYARNLLRQLLSSADMYGAHTAYLEVRPSNQSAIDLYLDEGFTKIGERPDYYPARGGRENAFVLHKELSDKDHT